MMQASGVSVRALSSPKASDSAPPMSGPIARPNRFWNSDSTEAPVERTPGASYVEHDRRRGPDSTGRKEAAEHDDAELARRAQHDTEMPAAERKHQRDHRDQAQHRDAEELAARVADAGTIDHHAEHEAAERAREHDQRRLHAGLVGRDAVGAVQETRQPRPQRRHRDQLGGGPMQTQRTVVERAIDEIMLRLLGASAAAVSVATVG